MHSTIAAALAHDGGALATDERDQPWQRSVLAEARRLVLVPCGSEIRSRRTFGTACRAGVERPGLATAVVVTSSQARPLGAAPPRSRYARPRPSCASGCAPSVSGFRVAGKLRDRARRGGRSCSRPGSGCGVSVSGPCLRFGPTASARASVERCEAFCAATPTGSGSCTLSAPEANSSAPTSHWCSTSGSRAPRSVAGVRGDGSGRRRGWVRLGLGRRSSVVPR